MGNIEYFPPRIVSLVEMLGLFQSLPGVSPCCVPLTTLPALQCDGRAALIRVVEQYDYRSLAQAIASLTVFAHLDTVAQTGGLNVFRSVRLHQLADRGTFVEVADCGGRVMMDDNRAPVVAFDWANMWRAVTQQFPQVQFRSSSP